MEFQIGWPYARFLDLRLVLWRRQYRDPPFKLVCSVFVMLRAWQGLCQERCSIVKSLKSNDCPHAGSCPVCEDPGMLPSRGCRHDKPSRGDHCSRGGEGADCQPPPLLKRGFLWGLGKRELGFRQPPHLCCCLSQAHPTGHFLYLVDTLFFTDWEISFCPCFCAREGGSSEICPVFSLSFCMGDSV